MSELVKTLSAKLKQAKARTGFAGMSVQNLQKEVDRLEDELVSEQEKYKAITRSCSRPLPKCPDPRRSWVTWGRRLQLQLNNKAGS